MIRLFFLFAFLANPSSGGVLQWGSQVFQNNLTSDGDVLTAEWSFALGYFAPGFVPSDSNTDQWGEQWTTLDVAPYSEQSKRFNSTWTDTGLVPNGRKGHIWGLNRNSSDPEWILVTATDWTFPLPPTNPLDPSSGESWSIPDASEVVLGAVDVMGIHMRTASTTGSPPLLSGEHWRRLVFLPNEQGDEEITAWTADPDLDDNSNLMEFAFGLDPKVKDRIQIKTLSGSGFFDFEVLRARNVAVDYFGRVSSDLETWAEGLSDISLLAETDGALVYRSSAPLADAPKRFGQVRVLLKP